MSVAREPMLILQQAAVIQLALVAVVALAVTCLMMPEGRRRLCETTARMGAARLRRDRRATEAADLSRYAQEVAVAASRAVMTAERRHEEWKRAERDREAAWLAYEAADEAARRATEAAMYSIPDISGSLGDAAHDIGDAANDITANLRRLHDAATEAYRRGELSAEQLGDVLAQRNGWDPQLPPYEQEAKLRRAVRDKLLAGCRIASEMERAARHAADTAAAAKRSLDDEASAAVQRARAAGTGLAVEVPRQRTAASALGVDAR